MFALPVGAAPPVVVSRMFQQAVKGLRRSQFSIFDWIRVAPALPCLGQCPLAVTQGTVISLNRAKETKTNHDSSEMSFSSPFPVAI